MPRLSVFNSVSLDGYFASANGDIGWTHQSAPDSDWDRYVAGNASGGGAMVFGRKTYDMMVQYWPTPQAMKTNREVAEGMNRMPKYVFSRTLDRPSWTNTTVLKGDPVEAMRKAKKDGGPDMVILGSGSIIPPLVDAGLVDALTMVVVPIVLGTGRTMFEGVRRQPRLVADGKPRSFANGNVVLSYRPT
jgi:dihydrofolate reductase